MALKKPPVRLVVGIMIFMTLFINYMTKVNMSISLVAMVKSTGGKLKKAECDTTNTTSNSTSQEDFGPRFEWNENVQAQILAGYFYGYLPTVLIGGLASEWFGAKTIIVVTNLGIGVVNALTVPAAHIHWGLVVTCRIVVGLFAGFGYPAVQYLIAQWAPPDEKGKFLGTMMGNTLGTVVTLPMVGWLTQAVGWNWGFYAISVWYVVFCVVFWALVSDSPESHKFISDDEKDYIITSQQGSVKRQKVLPPYAKILTSGRFYAYVIAQFGNLWGLFFLITCIPKFFADVLGFNLKRSGFLSALPYLARLIFGSMFGIIGDCIKRRSIMSATAVRKTFTISSHILPACMLIAIVFCGCNWKAVVGLLFMAQAFNGAAVITVLMNSQDLAPNFAATLYGVSSFIASMTGFIVPTITGALLSKNNGLKEWHYVFVIGGIAYAACGVIFMIFGTAELQPWNETNAV